MKSTLSKYLITYIAIFTAFVVGYFLLFEVQVRNEFLEKNNQNRLSSVNYTMNVLANQFNQLQNLSISINEEISLETLGFDSTSRFKIGNIINDNKRQNLLISDIIYIDNTEKEYISSSFVINFTDDGYILETQYDEIFLPYDRLIQNPIMELLSVTGETENQLIFLPKNNSANKITLFVIDKFNLETYFNLSSDFSSLGIIDSTSNEILYEIGEECINIDGSSLNSTYYEEDGHFYYISSELLGSFKVFGSQSIENLFYAENSLFENVYYGLFLFAIIILIFIVISLRLTYVPLYKLAKKLSTEGNLDKNFLKLIDDAYSDQTSKSLNLENEVNDYKSAIKYYVLGDLVRNDTVADEQFDEIFKSDREHLFYIVKIFNNNNSLATEVRSALGENSVCILLNSDVRSHTLLVDFYAKTIDKNEKILNLFEKICQKYDCKAGISAKSSDVNQLTSLYNNVKFITEDLFLDKNILQYSDDLRPKDAKFTRIYDNIAKFDDLFIEKEYKEIKSVLDELLISLNDRTLPEFYIKCILTDIITVIFKYNHNVEGEISMKLLNLVRHHDYFDEKQQISDILHSIIYDNENLTANISVDLIKNYILENYADVNFSLQKLALDFNVSSAYLSFLFKKHTNITLSDYVWQLRQEQIIKYLAETDLTIEEISIKVGYDNVSSLRRKFKKETGKTPHQFRKNDK